jgi:nucleotide-binding universal stress UspA family protein
MSASHFTIIVPVDFTEASNKAVHHAITISKTTGGSIDLFHVLDELSPDTVNDKLEVLSDLVEAAGISVKTIIGEGPILSTITETAKKGNYKLMVIGTHGPKGVRQILFGADIMRVLRHNPCPAVVVQKDADPEKQIRKILLPVGNHENYLDLVRATCLCAIALDASVTIYWQQKPYEQLKDGIFENIQVTRDLMDQFDVNYDEVKVEPAAKSSELAKQIMAFAKNGNYDMVGLMPNANKSDDYFGDSDKEKVLTNEENIPILCSKG